MRNSLISPLFFLMLWACADNDHSQAPQDAPSDVNMEIVASIEGLSDGPESRAYGETGYQNTYFANLDQIGIYVTRTRTDGQPAGIENIYAQYQNLGYKYSTSTSAWTILDYTDPQAIKIPMFSTTRLDLYAYYPFAARAQVNAGTNIIQNANDPHNISFRILQAQTPANLGLCNIMRAQYKNQSYSKALPASTPALLEFKHIMTLLEFKVCKDNTEYYKEDQPDEIDPEATWAPNDSIFLKNIVVLGQKISTEGMFDVMGDDPNVRVTRSVYAKGSVYKKDNATGTALKMFDATTGATMRRHIIIPPVPPIPADEPDPDSELGEQGSMEIMLELEWKPAGATQRTSTNRHYIVKGMQFEGGKKYVVYLLVKRQSTGLQKITQVNCTATPWDNTTWSVTFN